MSKILPLQNFKLQRHINDRGRRIYQPKKFNRIVSFAIQEVI